MLDNLANAFLEELQQLVDFLPELLFASLVLLAFYGLGRLLAKGAHRLILRSSMPSAYHPYFVTLIRGLTLLVGIIVFLNMIGYGTLATSLVAGGGLTAVVLGFAFKDIGENFLAGFFLAFSRPFNTDDVIETEGVLGRVKSIQLRHIHIRTADGCDVFVPSVQLFTKPLHNYTLDGLRRGSFTVGIDYGDDARAAADMLLEVTQNTPGVLGDPKASVQIKGFDPNFVQLQVFFWIRSTDQELTLTSTRFELMNNCREALQKKGYTFSSSVTTAVEMRPVEVSLNR
ncbi:MAG: mechanosensitive ion channel family protein [Balneolaceae bacterium]|nr:mechanosensitive ion channel family protein [Balneolaceae bacterium]